MMITDSIKPAQARTIRWVYALAAVAMLLSLGQSSNVSAQGQWTTNGNNINTTNTGNVGIGTTNPANGKVEIVSDDGVATGEHSLIYASRSGTSSGGIKLGYRADGTSVIGGFLRGLNNSPLFIGTTAVPQAFTLNNSGYVGIGTTAPLGTLHVPDGRVIVGQNYYPGATLSVGRADAIYPGIVSATNYSDGAKPIFRARSFSSGSLTGEGIYTFLGQRDDTTRTFSADYAGNGYFAGSVNAVGGLCIAGVCKTDWSQVGGTSSSQWTTAGTNLHYTAGNVGIGTTNPLASLQIGGYTTFNNPTAPGHSQFINNAHFSGTWRYMNNDPASLLQIKDGLIYLNAPPAAAGSALTWNERMRIDNAGNMGLGTAAPEAKLHVVGDLKVTGNISAKYQDVAEWVPSRQQLAAGTVVVLDTEQFNHVVASSKVYDTRVAGVISAQPGLSLGERGEGKVLVATTGRVLVKVDATRAPIHVGDLLVTSNEGGVAMKSQPLDLGGVAIHRPGTIIGKALQSLDKGTGEILVLLSLQ